jgi:hypothetical protein
LPRSATWAIGLALGVISANAPITHEIPPGAQTSDRGDDSGYYYRDLPKAIGDPLAVGLLAVGVPGLIVGRFVGRRPPVQAGRPGVVTAYFWTLVLLVSLVPLILGPAASPALFEVHIIAVSAVLLDAWEHRHDARHLHALWFAFLIIGAIAAVWQANVALLAITPWTFFGLVLYVPPVLIMVSLAGTTVESDRERRFP